MRVLGIETSCDETGVAIYDSQHGLMAQALHSQIKLHQQYGGVVPELASRDHVKYLIPLVDEVLQKSESKKTDLSAVAYTAGPGLIGALLTGASFAKSLALALKIPSLAVHHLEAHLLVTKLETNIEFPFLALLVSGGHSLLLVAWDLGKYEILGTTVDDAVGEAFDKTAKLMGMAYPGGAVLAEFADNYSLEHGLKLPRFPRPMTDRPGLDFSFSGLKTHALSAWSNSLKDEEAKSAIAYYFQQAVIDTLEIKCERAIAQTKIKKLVVAGGVGANKSLRRALQNLMQKLDGEVFFPHKDYCTDNGVMVAYTGWLHLSQGEQDSSQSIEVRARWPFA